MRIKKLRIKAALFAVFAAALFLSAVNSVFSQEKNFTWSLAMSSAQEAVSFTRPVSMKTGDIFTIYLQSETSCFAYVLAQDSENKIVVLHSGSLNAGEELLLGPMQITPPGGSETFYVVMSLEEQKQLKNTINAFNRNNTNSRASRNVLNAVMDLRRAVSRLREEPEKPVYMGGAFRGSGTPGIEGVSYSGLGTYVKTIIINH
jgi:hypothetical protein